MEQRMPGYPFEVPFAAVLADVEPFIDMVFASLESEFLVMPKGQGFVEYPEFESGYEALKTATTEFEHLDPVRVLDAVIRVPVSFVVLRAMLGFTPPEWAYVASSRTGVEAPQGFVRTWDRKARLQPRQGRRPSALVRTRLDALVRTACQLLEEGAPQVGPGALHRLDKADTRSGRQGIRSLARLGAPYAMLLYERFLGRPFAGHRDSVSELVGDVMEAAIEEALDRAGVSYRKTKRAERIEGFDQTPDFIIPSEFNPQVVIEAKITEDDGTARDKTTRIQHLDEMSRSGLDGGGVRYEVVACIGGRGFSVRRKDMEKILCATRGKVFTLRTLDRLVENTRLAEFRTR